MEGIQKNRLGRGLETSKKNSMLMKYEVLGGCVQNKHKLYK